MIKIAICDDESVMCATLKHLISQKLELLKTPFTTACFSRAQTLLSSPLDFDLIFLDIGMPDLDGISAARMLRERGFLGSLIFVTIMPEYMPEAFEVEAVDYLCKPIDEARLENALKRALKHIEKRGKASLFIQTMNWCRCISPDDIYYCEVINRKIYLHTRDEVIEYYGRLKDLEKKLNEDFIKCHRSYLINLAFLQKYENSQVTLEDGSQIPVSRTHHQLLMDAMLHYLGRRREP